jgi:hypothetical protein
MKLVTSIGCFVVALAVASQPVRASSITYPVDVYFSTGTIIDGDSFPVARWDGVFDPSLGTVTSWSVRFEGTVEISSIAEVVGDPGSPVSLSLDVAVGWSAYVDNSGSGDPYNPYYWLTAGAGTLSVSANCSGIQHCQVDPRASAPVGFSTGLRTEPLPDTFGFGMGATDYSLNGVGGDASFIHFGGGGDARGTAYLTVHYDPVPEPSAALVFAAAMLLVRAAHRHPPSERRTASS